MSRNDSNKDCQHGWDGEHYKVQPGDSLTSINYKNNVNDALDRVTGQGADTAGEQVMNSMFDSHTLFTGPKKIEEACKCNDRSERDNSNSDKSSGNFVLM